MHKTTGVAVMARSSWLGSPEKKVGNYWSSVTYTQTTNLLPTVVVLISGLAWRAGVAGLSHLSSSLSRWEVEGPAWSSEEEGQSRREQTRKSGLTGQTKDVGWALRGDTCQHVLRVKGLGQVVQAREDGQAAGDGEKGRAEQAEMDG